MCFFKPDGNWVNHRGSRFHEFRGGGCDLVVIVLGGNDLAETHPVNSISENAKLFVRCEKV